MKLSNGSIIIIVVAALLGLLLGNGLAGSFGSDPGSGLVWALMVGVISAAGAYFATSNHDRIVEQGVAESGAAADLSGTQNGQRIAELMSRVMWAIVIWVRAS